jgi:hypothetical protein
LRHLSIILALVTGLVASAGSAQDFVDTRLTITFGDDDLLSQTGEQVPISPLPGFGDRRAYELFFDNLNTRFSGRETLTHLVVYKRMPAFAEDLTTEAAMVVRLNLETVALADAGSYIRLAYNPWEDAPEDGLQLVLFPFDSERFRLGYLYSLSFGGADFIPRRSLFRAPGMKLQFDRGAGYYFLGFKTLPARTPLTVEIRDPEGLTEAEVIRVDETQYMVLGGAGWDLAGDRLRIEFGAGWFQQGRLDLPGYPRAPVYSFGEAARIAWHENMSLGSSIDFSLYRNDPDSPFIAFRPVSYTPGQFGYLISLEGAAVQQHLADFDRTNSTTLENGLAGALQARFQYDYWRLELTGLYRDLGFILKNVPSFVPFVSIPEDATVNPELFFAATTDYHLPEPHLTLALSAGIQFPATFTTETRVGSAEPSRTQVIRREGFVSILPPGINSVPILQLRVQMRLDVSEMLYTFLWVQYIHDENATRLVVSATEGTRRVFQAADQIGFGLSMAARF